MDREWRRARTVVAQAAVRPDLLEALQVLAQLHVKCVGDDLRELAVLVVLLPVEHPVGNLELARVLHDGHQTLNLLSGQLASPENPGRAAPAVSAQPTLILTKKSGHTPTPIGRARGGGCSPLGDVDLGLFAAHVGEAAPDTLDRGEREHHLDLAVKVSVEHTQNVLEVGLVHDERTHGSRILRTIARPAVSSRLLRVDPCPKLASHTSPRNANQRMRAAAPPGYA